VVDNSTFSPIGLTVHSDALYYQEALDISISSGEGHLSGYSPKASPVPTSSAGTSA
jgi:hypothetical protein